MKKRFLSFLMVVLSILTLFPYSAFAAGNYRYCPNCGYVLHTTYRGLDNNDLSSDELTGIYYLLDICTECDYFHKEVRLGSIYLDNVTRPGNTPDIPGYTAPSVPSINASGKLLVKLQHRVLTVGYEKSPYTWSYKSCPHSSSHAISSPFRAFSCIVNESLIKNVVQMNSNYKLNIQYGFEFVAPVDGYYIVPEITVNSIARSTNGDWSEAVKVVTPSRSTTYFNKGAVSSFATTEFVTKSGVYHEIEAIYPYVECEPIGTSSITTQTNITINNTNINGDIYFDNSTNLYYIYQEGITVPVIYNPETTEVTTYDNDTNNYYTIIINPELAPTPSPTPDPGSTDPSPTPDPGSTDPTPTPAPGSTDPSNPGAGGSTPGNPFGDIFGGALDLLQDVLGAILSVIWTLLSSLFGIVTWLITQITTLIPFLPAPAVAALAGGVILVIIIKILRFIGGLLP